VEGYEEENNVKYLAYSAVRRQTQMVVVDAGLEGVRSRRANICESLREEGGSWVNPLEIGMD
jgi:hypothetical protein